MQLLGPYNTNLNAFTYQQLLAVYRAAIAQGGFAGNQVFDTATIQSLLQQAQDFTQLPLPAAGQRSTDDALNFPLSLLTARYNALVAETNDYVEKTGNLIEILKNDTGLLDQLLAGVDLNSWIAARPRLTGATEFFWDYGMGPGPVSSDITQVDPLNGVIYPSECPTATYLDVVDSSQHTGMAGPSVDTTVPARDAIWQWIPMTAGEQSQTLSGEGWAELDVLETYPLLNFLPDPTIQLLLPIGGSIQGVFNISGMVVGGSLPIFVQTVFKPRRNSIIIAPQNALSNSSFDAGSTDWTFGGGWSVQSDSDAHSGSNDVIKASVSVWNASINYAPGNHVSYLGYEWQCILTGNAGIPPNAIDSIYWILDGALSSSVFPLRPKDKIYVEAWVKSLAANGIVNICLSCLDHNGVVLDPQVFIPGVSSADNWLEISDTLQAIDNQSVAFGRVDVTVFGQTTGFWKMDDFRVHLPQNLSSYVVNQDDASVYISLPNSDLPSVIFLPSADFIVDDISNIIFMGMPDGVSVTVRFTESFPAYQCSVNQTVWSPLIMLDPNRPYPDKTTQFFPINIGIDSDGNRTLFPITDELGNPTGLTMQIVGSRIPFQYYFEVTTQATPQYGATAVLQVDLSRPTFMNGFTLAPFSNYPIRLLKVETQAFGTDTRQTVGLPNVVIDRPVTLTFPKTLLQIIYLTCYQENYNLSIYEVQPPDALRRDVLFSLQSNLPFNVRRAQRAVPTFYTGAQYSFGLENLAGLSSIPDLPGVFIAGPHTFHGLPELIRFDADFIDEASVGGFEVYLCWRAFSASNAVLDQELTGKRIYSEVCEVFPLHASTVVVDDIDHVDIYLKFVFRDSETVLQRYLLQVTNA